MRAIKLTSTNFYRPGTLKEAAESLLKVNKNKTKARENKPKIKMNKELGQHILKNPGIITKIIESANIRNTDTVLEIGPGTGNLTVQLCSVARKVRAIELDQRMIAELKRRVMNSGYSNLEIIHGNALKTDFGQFNICTANLPYQISSPFLFKLITCNRNFRCAVLMFQKEFGERLIAKPGDICYCRISVNTQLFCKATRVCNVSAKNFNPPPKVDSIVIKIEPNNNYLQINYVQWNGLLRTIFNRKHKTIRSILTNGKTCKKLYDIYLAHNADNTADNIDGISKFKELLDKVLKTPINGNFYVSGENEYNVLTNTELMTDDLNIIDDSISVSGSPKTFYSSRAIELSIIHMLKLLYILNSNSIYFSSVISNKADSFDLQCQQNIIPTLFSEDLDSE